mmetsp:Transcript_8055/g.12783  ORF Transcript_8055/g.12783 Transcript_8055/m.12783 type:complete len:102 (-) Transcript_8055:278-583(-)
MVTCGTHLMQRPAAVRSTIKENLLVGLWKEARVIAEDTAWTGTGCNCNRFYMEARQALAIFAPRCCVAFARLLCRLLSQGQTNSYCSYEGKDRKLDLVALQ